MELSKHRRIADSSVIIGFPPSKETEYSRYYEGKQLFYCSVSITELSRHFKRLANKGHLSPNRVGQRVAERFHGISRLVVTDFAISIARYLLVCYEQVWELENREETDYGDLLIAGCAIEHRMPLIAHDKLFQKIEIMFPRKFRLYTLLPPLSRHAVSQAQSKLGAIKSIETPW